MTSALRTSVRKVVLRLRSERAETIAETLVGILIASLSMALLASATAASTVIVERTRASARVYYAATSSLASDTSAHSGGSVSVTQQDVPGVATVRLDLSTDPVSVSWNEQEFPGGRVGVSYRSDEG